MAARVGGLVLVAILLIGGAAPTASVHAATTARAAPVLDIVGSLGEGSVLTGMITGVPAPGPSGSPPDGLFIHIKINGVTVQLPGLVWSYNDGMWEFTYRIPAGSAGSVITINVISLGDELSRSFSVGG